MSVIDISHSAGMKNALVCALVTADFFSLEKRAVEWFLGFILAKGNWKGVKMAKLSVDQTLLKVKLYAKRGEV